MKTLMKTAVVGFALIFMLAAIARSLGADERDIAGNWTLDAEGYIMKMVLIQSGKKLTGTLEITHGPFPH